MYCKCCGQLFIVPVTTVWEVLQHRIDVCEFWGQLVREIDIQVVHIVDIDKFGTKYSMHKIAHAKHWELHTSSLEGCIAY